MMLQKKFWEYCPLLAGFCFVLPATNIAVQEISWLLHIKAIIPSGVIALVIGVMLIYFYTRHEFNRKEFLSILLLFVLLFVVSGVIAIYYFDSTRDGLAYHQEAIIQIKEGWNPITSSLPDNVPYAFFINHYPKASWSNSATLYAMTERIESGKLFNILYTAGTFLIVLYLLIMLKFELFWAAACALLATLNSITIVQFQSHMVDHINANVITSLVAILLLIVIMPSNKRYGYLLILALLVVFDTKFTSVVNAVMLFVFFNAGIFFFKRSLFRETLLFTVLAGIVYLVTSVNPYITNMLDGKHPLYPTMGAGSSDVIAGQVPENYIGGNRFMNLANSVFSASENDVTGSRLKLPGTLTWKEFAIFSSMADMRKGGFGPTFSLLFIVACLLFLVTIYGSSGNARYVVVFITFALLIMVAINPANWWARLVPQLWIVPLIWLFYAILYAPKNYSYAAKVVVMVALLIQGFYFASYLYYENTKAVLVRRQLKELKNQHNQIYVDFGPCASVRKRLKEYGIPFGQITIADRKNGKHKLENSTAAFEYSNKK